MGENIRITVIATGFERASSIHPVEPPAPKAREEALAYPPKTRQAEKVERPVPTPSVPATVQASSQLEFAPRVTNTEELDIPTFLRNRQHKTGQSG